MEIITRCSWCEEEFEDLQFVEDLDPAVGYSGQELLGPICREKYLKSKSYERL